MRLAIVAVVIVLCAAVSAYLYLSYIQPAPADSAAQTQLPPSPATTTTAAPRQAINSTSTTSAVPAPTTSNPSAATSTTSSDAAEHPGMKLYRNDEYGFEFWYPQELTIRENSFYSPNSKFNLDVILKDGKHDISVFSLNVASPEFADTTFSGYPATTTSVTVNGISGTRYDYFYEGLPEIAVILPLTQNKAILGIDGEAKPNWHPEIFESILDTFEVQK
jgi:hypothetical protein